MNNEMILAAALRIEGHALRTPLLNAPLLDAKFGRRIFVKAECLQKTGSFKYRGARSAISALDDGARAKGVIAFSSGNHAQGIACVAAEMGAPAVIVMPRDAPALKLRNTKLYGAEVVTYDRQGNESREAVGAEIAEKRGLTLIRPYDEPQVIAGQGTVGLELAHQAAQMGVDNADVLVCCGGGGLTSGVALALETRGPGLRARPVEPETSDGVARSLASGKIKRNEGPPRSICDAIVTPAPGDITFPIMQALCGPGYTVSDDEALRAMAFAWRYLKIVLEPGGAVSLAAALFHTETDRDVIAVATGGNVDAEMFKRALDTIGPDD